MVAYARALAIIFGLVLLGGAAVRFLHSERWLLWAVILLLLGYIGHLREERRKP